ncbi:uncharacterized protein LOC107361406 [Tetranychus urticae]|uniref:uncharacterized protein LOC107361406 n=1 Tax=Tetranychus urticae TaxID=32264 RepID=UPI00077BFCCB|nr:uncharacterized protein LOC107361406 [Tetranychus urticae]
MPNGQADQQVMSEPSDINLTTQEKGLPKKRGRPKGYKPAFTWTLEKSIQLLSKRKEMDCEFIGAYAKSDVWIKLINSLGWNVGWKTVRDKFMNLKKLYNKKPATGVAGSYRDSVASQELFELISYFCDGSHKNNPPKVIDSCLTSSTEQETNQNESQFIPSAMDDLQFEEIPENQSDNLHSSEPLDDDFNFSDLNANLSNSESQLNSMTQTGSQSSSNFSFNTQASTSSSSSRRSRSPTIDDEETNRPSKKVRRYTSYRDIFLGNAKVLNKIAQDFTRFTNAACPLYESWKNAADQENLRRNVNTEQQNQEPDP